MLLKKLKNINEMQAVSSITGFKKKKSNKLYYIICGLFGIVIGVVSSYYFWDFLMFLNG